MACGGVQPGDAGRSSQALAARAAPPTCLAPWGVDLCAATGITAAFAIPTDWGATPIRAGDRWTTVVGWGTNAPGGLPGWPLEYHPGYVTDHPNDPMQDFVAKFVKFTIVVDPGTRQERRYEFRDPSEVFARLMTVADFWGSGFLGPAGIDGGQWIAYAPVLHPLSVGQHEIRLITTLSAESCDGFPSGGGEPLTFEGGHCLPAGDFAIFPVWHPWAFAVAPR